MSSPVRFPVRNSFSPGFPKKFGRTFLRLGLAAGLWLWGFGGRLTAAAEGVIRATQTTVTVGRQRLGVKLVKAKLDQVRIKVGLAQGRVGRTEELAGIAKRYRAVAAINGCFFDAYTNHPIKNPHHTLITDGQVVHKGNVGTLLGFTARNEARLERVEWTIEGSREGSYTYPHRWYAYWLNRFPTADTVTIFTPHWGTSTGLKDGTQVVVSNGRVAAIGRGSQPIPAGGYVIYFRGVEGTLLEGFKVGQEVAYRVVRKDGGEMGFWSQVQEGLAAGPRLVTDGRITLDPQAEGFTSPKILTLSGARSAVGWTRDGWLLLAVTNGTVRQLAEVMKALGAVQAMNLDGGASSGLWFRGQYLRQPGRLISNALLVLER